MRKVCSICKKGVCVQERKARDFRRQAEKENEGPQNGGGGAGGYRGPDGTGQWISMGELDPTEDLDQALSSLGGGTPSFSCMWVAFTALQLRGGRSKGRLA